MRFPPAAIFAETDWFVEEDSLDEKTGCSVIYVSDMHKAVISRRLYDAAGSRFKDLLPVLLFGIRSLLPEFCKC